MRLSFMTAFVLMSSISVISSASAAAAEVPRRGAASTQPAKRWEHAFVSGNGTMGAMAFGQPLEETIIVNHARLFLPTGGAEIVPELGQFLPEVRRIIREESYRGAVRFMMDKAKPQGYTGLVFTDPFHPGFELKIATPAAGEVTQYLRTENFESGELSVRWRDERGQMQRRMFVSRPDNVIVMSIGGGGDGAGKFTGELTLPPIPDDANVRWFQLNHPELSEAERKEKSKANSLIQTKVITEKDRITFHNVYREGKGGYDGAIRIAVRGGSSASDGRKISITDADEVVVIARIEPFTKVDQSKPDALNAALNKLPTDYDALLAAHAKVHGELFNRVTLDLGGGGADRSLTTDELLARAAKENKLSPALIEKLYDGSRYVFISSCSDQRPPNLQGIWTGTWEPAWSGDYTTDTNVQLAVAAGLSGNTPELMEGLFCLVEDSLGDWRLNANNFYGCDGVMAPTRQSNNGKMFHWSDRFTGHFWTAGAAWLSHWFYDYYQYTGDRDFLAKRAVPLMKEVAAFYEDFLFVDDTGKYRFSPAYSAENGAGDNPAQDIAVAKQLLTNLVAACETLQIEPENVAKWRAVVEKLPAYRVNEDGALAEWSDPRFKDNYAHRHMMHLYPLFQSYEFSRDRTPQLWRAAEVAYEKRMEHWFRSTNPKTDTSSHGRMHLALSAATLGRGADVEEILTKMATSGAIYPSMVTAHYANGRTFNVDANGAMPEVIHNSLVFSQPGRLHLLPALPPSWTKGEIRGILARGQIRIERLAWEAGAVEVTLVSGKDQTVSVSAPNAPAREVELKTGKPQTIRIPGAERPRV